MRGVAGGGLKSLSPYLSLVVRKWLTEHKRLTNAPVDTKYKAE